MRHRSAHLLTLLACLALLLSACGLGAIGSVLTPEEAEVSLEETETCEAEESVLACYQRASASRSRRGAARALVTTRSRRPSLENPRRSAPPGDAWERPLRC